VIGDVDEEKLLKIKAAAPTAIKDNPQPGG
jgi:hypothetical protein